MKTLKISTYLLAFIFKASSLVAQINYVDIPDTTLYYPVLQNTTDSTNYIHLDLNSDGIMDLYVSAHYWTQWVSPSDPNFPNHYMKFNGENNNIEIASATGPLCPEILNSGDSVNSSLNWANQADLFIQVYIAGQYSCGVPYYDKYFAIKFFHNGQQYFGWMRVDNSLGLTIKDYAYNLIPNTPITAGQTTTNITEFNYKKPLLAYFDLSNDQIIVLSNNISPQSNVTISDQLGRELFKSPILEKNIIINANSFKNGIYILRTFDGKHTDNIQRIIIGGM